MEWPAWLVGDRARQVAFHRVYQGLMLGGWPPPQAAQWAEEAVAEAIRRAVSGLIDGSTTLENECHYIRWLDRVARNWLIDRGRRLKTTRLVPLGDDQDVVAPHNPRGEVLPAVRRCLDRLPGEDRVLLELAYDEGLTDRELGDRLLGDTPEKGRARRARLRRLAALDRLRPLLVEAGLDPDVIERIRPGDRAPGGYSSEKASV